MDGASFMGEANLVGMNVGGQIAMGGASFAKQLIAESMIVGAGLSMNNRATFSDNVDVQNSKISGEFLIRDAFFSKILALAYVRGLSEIWWDHAAIATSAFGRPMGSNR